MESYVNQCHVCSRPFPTQQRLQQHIWHYQTEIATLLAKLHELFAHQSPELKTTESPDDRASLLPIVNAVATIESEIDTLPPAQTEDEEKSQSRFRRATNKSNPSDQQREFACPECPAGFARKQDLERHYTTHYQCKEFCQFCSNTFTTGRKYVTHKCAKAGPLTQRTYVKRRCTALLVEAKRDLYAKKSKMECVTETASQIKRRPSKVPDVGNEDETQYEPPTLSSEVEALAPVEAENHGHSRQTGAVAFDSDHSAFVTADDTQYSHSPPLHPPLFWPLGISWQSQLLEFPSPLWSTVSVGAESTSLPPRHGPVSNLGSMSDQLLQMSTAQAEMHDDVSFDCL
ncbi:hypothetical protein CORC01_14387 [Colletotrichum orchidophilum]|uniref:C2H2-type domain-containing protein n=1 Tax=Colletotrichum orchidophilum TaxID=1209926 RepID=A0A1G4AMB9_9PEZI|nr:uncharacterized protein CORC01_14387 [Colletotrichum orchidophilum]OHE90314.1 hypothetical protein CORC01_14387 [Colletotrichum orchidophilum]